MFASCWLRWHVWWADELSSSPSSVLVYFLFALWSLAFIIGSRTSGLNPFSLASWSKWSVPRLLCLGNYLMSAAFFLSAIVLLFGVGIGRNETACSTGNVVCIVFYAL